MGDTMRDILAMDSMRARERELMGESVVVSGMRGGARARATVQGLSSPWRWRKRDREGGGWFYDYDVQGGGQFEEWFEVRPSDVLHAVAVQGGHVEEGQSWGLFSLRGFRRGEAVGCYVGKDLGEEHSAEADAAVEALVEQGRGRHVLVKGFGRGARVIDGRLGFNGMQYANTARGVAGWTNNLNFGQNATFTALRNIACGQELTFEYDKGSGEGVEGGAPGGV